MGRYDDRDYVAPVVPKWVWVVGVLLILGVIGAIFGGGAGGSSSGSSGSPGTVDASALKGLNMDTVTVFDSPDGIRKVCSLSGGARVQTFEVRSERVRIESGSCEGWVPKDFIK